jgi:PEP-CTERM motif
VNDPNGPRVRVRRRRSRRHQRNRLYRRVILCSVFLLGGLAGAALLPFDFASYLRSSLTSQPPAQWSNTDVHRDLAFMASPDSETQQRSAKPARPVYPYSLVPGGVHDPKELEQAFEHDPVLASHYKDFDFRRARVVELSEDRTVYVSYRIAGHVYWTTKRVLLRKGEKVITDGKMTLRTRCGNQVSENARNEVSPQEPSIAKMEDPVKMGAGSVAPYPVNFDSALTRPELQSFGPAIPAYGLIVNNGGILTLYPPPLPSCGPGKTKKGNGNSGGTSDSGSESSGGKKKNGGCGAPPAEVPEPGTMILFATGLAAAFTRYRHQLRHN